MDPIQAPEDNTAGATPRIFPDVSTGEVISAGATAEAIDTDYWYLSDREEAKFFKDAYGRAQDLGFSGTKAEMNYGPSIGMQGGIANYNALVNEEESQYEAILAARQAHPEAFEGIPVTREEMIAATNGKLREEWDDAQQVMANAPDTFLGRTVPEFIGRAGTAVSDQANVMIAAATFGLGAQASLGRLVLTEAGLGLLGEAATLPRQFEISERLGTPEPNVPLQLTLGALMAGVMPVGFRGAGYGAGKVYQGSRELVKSLRSKASELTPEQRGAQYAIERQIAEEDAGPAAKPAENWQATDEALAALDEGRPADIVSPDPSPDRVEVLTTPPADRPAAPAPPRARPVEANIAAMIRDSEARNSYDTMSDFSVIAPPKPITQMTLDELDAWQTANRDAGAESTAAGGYQIIRDTMRDLRARMGLTGSEVFTEELQDRMATELMRDAGLDDFKAGKIPADQFADNLAEIWAAIPNASGRSHYAGDGLNGATIARRQVLNVLGGEIFISGRRAAPTMTRVPAGSVGVDAQTYQFRTAVNDAGVEAPLDRVREWDELLAGDVIIHERRDGSRWIADGHHRRDLAARLEAEGHPPIEFNAFVLREDEGYSVADVRAIAAVKNIEAGNASAIDAAKVLRVDPAMLEKLTLRNSQARDARGLMKLSDDGFDMVTNGLVREDHAAIVGELTADATMQGAVLRAMIGVKPRNLAEARQVAADAYRAGLAKSEAGSQSSLFGDGFDMAETLFKERAAVMARATAQLRNDKRVFSTLVRDSARIKEAGNELTEATNAARVTTDETALALVEKLVNRAGPLDDALSDAARAVRSGSSIRSAVDGFLGDLRSALEGGDLGRLMDGADGRTRDAATPDGAADEGARRGISPERQRELEGGAVPSPEEFDQLTAGEKPNSSVDELFADAFEGLNSNAVKYQDVPPIRNREDWADQAETMPPAKVFPPRKKAERVFASKVAGDPIDMAEAQARVAEWRAEAQRMGAEEDHSNKVIVSLFDHTGNWSRPWEEAGFRVLRYDIANSEFQDLLEFFPTGDFMELWARGLEVYGVLSACPCTTFASSGARWWKPRHDVPDNEMVEKMFGWRMARYFDTPLEANKALGELTRVAVEMTNPTGFHVLENPRGRIRSELELPEAGLIFDPNHYGDPYTKETYLYGDFKNDLPGAHVEATEGSKMQNKLRGDRPEDKAERSKTPEGFAYSFFMANRPTDGAAKIQRPNAAIPAIPADRAELADLVAAGSDRATIDSHPAMVKALGEMAAIPETHLAEGYRSEAWHAARTYDFDGEQVTGLEPALDRWVEEAKTLAWRELGITPEPLQSGAREVIIVLGPPAAGKSTIANEIAVARKAAILDSDEIKKTLPEFNGGIGANAVHEESSDLVGLVEADLMAEGFNAVVPKVGASAASIEATVARWKAAGYSVDLVNMAVTKETAYSRMIGRFVEQGRLIAPDYVDHVGDKPSATFRELQQKGIADGYAEIDFNGGRDTDPPVELFGERNPFVGSRYDPETGGRKTAAGSEPGRTEDPRSPGRGAASEVTDAGDQLVTPGVKPITDKDRLLAMQNKPMRGGSAEADGGLFDLGARDQTDMFSDAGRNLFDDAAASTPEALAQLEAAENAVRAALDAGEIFDVPTGRMVDGEPEVIAAADVLADLDADDNFLGALDVCKS